MDYHRPTSTGTFDFGCVDSSKDTGSIGYTPVNATGGEWAVAITGMQVGPIGKFIEAGWNIIVDTGAGQSSVSRWVADIYFARIPNSTCNAAFNTYQFPCSATLLDFTFGVPTEARFLLAICFGAIDGTKCVSQLLVATGTVIWGQTFIEAQYIVLDWDNSRISFANKPH